MTVSVSELDVAWALLGQRRYAEALQQSAAILARYPQNVSAMVCHAMAHWQNGGDVAMAVVQMRRALTLAPDVASIRHNFASVLASTGDVSEAVAQFHEALRLKPDDTMAFYGLTQNSKFAAETDLVRAMMALEASGRLDEQGADYLAFALAKVFDDLRQPERAMAYAEAANGIAPRPFDREGEARALTALAGLTERDAFRRAGAIEPAMPAPVFIVGMNRSGTTLVESILSRHPDVAALGELGDMYNVEELAMQLSKRTMDRNTLASKLSREWLADQAGRLGRAISARTGAARLFTDKLPENALRLGLISRIFPNARVIYVRRHPLDTGISNFFQRFQHEQGFSYRMDWIGARTRQIADSMALWKRAVDLPILDVSYEKLVADFEVQARRIVDFAGLDWRSACLEPSRTRRAVLTASQWQVRQPVHSGSVGRWTRYERWLGPMIEAMGGFEWIDREVAEISG